MGGVISNTEVINLFIVNIPDFFLNWFPLAFVNIISYWQDFFPAIQSVNVSLISRGRITHRNVKSIIF